jgi:hypothetical protein
MLKVIAGLLYLRNQPRAKSAIAAEIENWSHSTNGVTVTARTVTGYIKEIGETLGLTRKMLGLSEREETPE